MVIQFFLICKIKVPSAAEGKPIAVGESRPLSFAWSAAPSDGDGERVVNNTEINLAIFRKDQVFGKMPCFGIFDLWFIVFFLNSPGIQGNLASPNCLETIKQASKSSLNL